MEKDKGYVIPHTHWDREWRYPIWKNRVLLIEFMEELLSILDNDPQYRCFLMDGQAVPIEDYLEVKPEERGRVTKYIKEGRIAVGPWYTLPDLYPLDGECLVRNLLKGIRVCKGYGDALKVGYNSFGWGQTAQFPQIYKGFGFDFIICAKKVSSERAPQSEFMWEAPDGTKVLTSRLGDFARANFFFHAYINTRYGLTFLSDEFYYSPDKAGVAIHKAQGDDCDEDYFLIKQKPGHDWSYLKPGVEKAWQGTEDTALKTRRLLLSGCDFSTPQPDLTEVLKKANELFSDKEFINCRLERYKDDLLSMVDKEKLRVVKGELRDGPSCDCSGNALSSRIYLKQLNKKAQNLIIGQAEPLSVMAEACGAEYPKGFFDVGWRYLLESHPHDSINGVTQDKTADDVENRLTQAIEIGEVLYSKAAQEIIKRIDFTDCPEDSMQLTVFNSLYHPVSDVVKVCIDTPKDKNIWSFRVLNETGKEIPVQHVSRREKSLPAHDLDGRPWPMYIDRHICYLDVGEIPSMGYRVFSILPKTTFVRNHHYWYEMRKTTGEEICKQDNVLENELLRVQINPNGTFDLTEKEQGNTYRGLHYFEDTGDVGNYWAYYPPYENETHTTLSGAPRIWLEDNGPLSATIAIEHRFLLPKSGREPLYGVQGESRRADELEELVITSRVTLKKGARRVDISTKLRNTVENHRLRVAFPTEIETDHSFAAGHFTVDRRPIISTKDENGEYYNEMQTLPMQQFVDLSDGKRGLALLNDCLTEFEVKGDDTRTAYLTLFRAMGNMIVTGWECVGVFPKQKGSQLLRELEFSYSVYPHRGGFENDVYFEAQKLNLPLRSYQTMGRAEGSLPRCHSFLSLSDKNVIVSALKKAEDRGGAVLRLFNPTDEEKTVNIRFAPKVKEAFLCNLNEEREQPVPVEEEHTLSLTVLQNQILTLEVKLVHPSENKPETEI